LVQMPGRVAARAGAMAAAPATTFTTGAPAPPASLPFDGCVDGRGGWCPSDDSNASAAAASESLQGSLVGFVGDDPHGFKAWRERRMARKKATQKAMNKTLQVMQIRLAMGHQGGWSGPENSSFAIAQDVFAASTGAHAANSYGMGGAPPSVASLTTAAATEAPFSLAATAPPQVLAAVPAATAASAVWRQGQQAPGKKEEPASPGGAHRKKILMSL